MIEQIGNGATCKYYRSLWKELTNQVDNVSMSNYRRDTIPFAKNWRFYDVKFASVKLIRLLV